MAKKILIVEDNHDTVEMTKVILEQAGYEVAVAYNGEEGYLQAKVQRPDLILLDIMMPIMDGYTMNRLLKGDAVTQKIPVIIISARSGMGPLFEDSKEATIQGYMVKPVNRKILLLKLDEVFKTVIS